MNSKFERFHEIPNQTFAKNVSCLSHEEPEKLIPKTNLSRIYLKSSAKIMLGTPNPQTMYDII